MKEWHETTVELIVPDERPGGNPFRRFTLKLVDVGVADRILVMECPEAIETIKRECRQELEEHEEVSELSALDEEPFL